MKKKQTRFFRSSWNYLIIPGVILTMAGFFSPWVDHQSAGLSITGFEMAEWIKFTPEVQSGELGLQRSFFYWPPLVCVAGLVVLYAYGRQQNKRYLILAGLAVFLSLLPFPLLEEITSLSGIKANAGRFFIIATGLGSVLIAVLNRKIHPRIWAIFLMMVAFVGYILAGSGFSAVEPIVERLFNHLIDPGIGFRLDQIGILILFIAGAIRLLA